MAYTPTNWVTGDTVTATKLNKIEQGIVNAEAPIIAKVVVDFRGGGIGGTTVVHMGYAKHISTPVERYSIESPLKEYLASDGNTNGYFAIPIPLSDANDDLQPYVFFEDMLDNISAYQVSGDISPTKIDAQRRMGANLWESFTYYGFAVFGNGKIVVSYDD